MEFYETFVSVVLYLMLGGMAAYGLLKSWQLARLCDEYRDRLHKSEHMRYIETFEVECREAQNSAGDENEK